MCDHQLPRSDSPASACTRRNALTSLGIGMASILGARVLHAETDTAGIAKELRDAGTRTTAGEGSQFSTPRESLEALYRGNRRFVDGAPAAPHRDRQRLNETAAKQTPFAAFLGCADSRVPIEIVFDQGFGDIFVTRVAGNVADSAIIASLEFGTEVLGAQVLYVLGHTRCGAITAAVDGAEVPGQISTLYQHLRRAVRETHNDANAAIRRNVQIQAEILSDASPVIGRRLRAGTLLLAGGVFDVASGLVTPVTIS